MCTPYPLRPGEADCRDFLRTGRCKYGESCKYNHPPNVESGGGVKPINPSEPLFPIRPTEPSCQYFLKHGTCKFGQSCKFNHPTGTSLGDGSGGSLSAGRLVFVTTNGSPGAMSGDASSHLMTSSTSVQVLPQRPTEPNCIYFLRNGKCKYGATCKFHHPLDAINRNNQVQQLQSANLRQPQNAANLRDRSQSTGSISEAHSQIQHGVTYATAANVTYMQPQRLHPITEQLRPQQPTHILLPDGKIAVILDPKSLQNVNDLNAQDRPKFYLSQKDGSIGTIQSIEQNNNPIVSPMLTATTNSTSNHTLDSNIDLMGINVTYQGQPQGAQARGPNKSGSGGSLSAYGSLDSNSPAPMQGDYIQQVSSQVHQQTMANNAGQATFPQYSAWPTIEGLEQPNQAQVLRSPPKSNDALDRLRYATNKLDSSADNAAAYYWPSNGSLPSISATDRDIQAGRNYRTAPNANPYLPSNAVCQPVHHSYSSQRHSSISPSASTEQIRNRHERTAQPQESSGDDEGLTMMTSALLTMMDRHESPLSENETGMQGSPSRSSSAAPSHNVNSNEVYLSHSEPNLQERAAAVRPPPGLMKQPPGMPNVDSVHPSYGNQEIARSWSPAGGGYFVGGYDQLNNYKSPPWGG
eukprot:CAMPEP_0183719176 /NCGR_PEP_ID=MMETSP0737-20130205/12232_1 /TAXON_ID=385413 /ORGANISM="Thalassiosira miniscula, Strain CCMP1093" /LENGTH=635 /DNA_ID=CAMNT_0025948883 /DNA_START=211 /DNA_END=2118 /DNA_ORIENTATION=+